MRARVRIVLASALVLSFVLVAPASASAAPVPVPAANDWKYDPSGTKWREWMLNIGSRLLGDATPRGWRAEQLANQFRAGKGIPSGDVLNKMYGYTELARDANGNLKPRFAPVGSGTYDDYVLEEAEKLRTNKSTRPGIRVPGTKFNWLNKSVGGVGGAMVALTGFQVGTLLGGAGTNLVGGWMGFDANGLVCAQANEIGDLGGFLLGSVSGQDCSAWQLANGFVPNTDGAASWIAASLGGHSIYGYTGTVDGGASSCISVSWDTNNGGRPTIQGTNPPIYIVVLRLDGTWGGVNITPPSGVSRCKGDAFMSHSIAGVRPSLGLSYSLTSAPDSVMTQGPNADPERIQTCTVTYTDGTTSSASGGPYRESSGSMSPAVCPPSPPGKVPANITITEDGSGTKHTLFDQPTTDAFQDWAQDYPECVTGVCTLDLLTTKDGSTYASCFDLLDGCPGWFEDPNKASTYTCRYGTTEVDLSECTVYAGLFQPGRITVGAPYSDPITGDWSGGENAPSPDRQAFELEVQDPGHRACRGMNVEGFDPVAFVMRPVQCALEWSFVPRPLVIKAAMTGAGEAWQGKPPAVIAQVVDSLSLPAGDSGCSIDVTLLGVTSNIINVCSGPMSLLPIISRLLTAVIMGFIVFHLVRRQIAAAVGYNTGQG